MDVFEVRPNGVFDQFFFADSDIFIPALEAAHGNGHLDPLHTLALEENPEEVGRPSILTHCVELLEGALLLSEYAISVVHPMLMAAGYIVPTSSPTQTKYGLFICEQAVDAFDAERSEEEQNNPLHPILRYELRGELLAGLDVFRLPPLRARLFVSSRFKQAVDADSRLTGFVFRHIWSSESGGVQYPPMPLTYEAVPGTLARQRKAKRDAMRERIAREGL